MSLFAKGCYVKCNDDYPYEVETTYQLKYYISSALVSIYCILEPDETMIGRFEYDMNTFVVERFKSSMPTIEEIQTITD